MAVPVSTTSKTAIVIWDNQLNVDHNSALLADLDAPVIMIEAADICRKYSYHKQKLLFVLCAMRDFADTLRAAGRTVYYVPFNTKNTSWFTTLQKVCITQRVDKLITMRASDRPPQLALEAWCRRHGIVLEITPNDLFLTPQSLFSEWADSQKRLHLEQFYRWQRRRLNILLDEDGKPTGGSWNYDALNRKPLPRRHTIPPLNQSKLSPHAANIKQLIESNFKGNPGKLDNNWLPTSRTEAVQWLENFLLQRLPLFGDYEDAMRQGEPFLYHSVLSPLLNIGLLHPQEVIDKVLIADAPLAAREGFIRQVIGWREFMFGLYHYKPANWIDSNYLNAHRSLEDYWWKLKNAPEPPLQDLFERLSCYGYTHHIERLMVAGNYLLLGGYNPRQVFDWFMTMYVDAYEWVMVPNVIGMSQYADGGIEHGGFATKPYISGSNYLQKMGKWWDSNVAAKESEWTSMYWEFLARHEDKLKHNYRLRPLFRYAQHYIDDSKKAK